MTDIIGQFGATLRRVFVRKRSFWFIPMALAAIGIAILLLWMTWPLWHVGPTNPESNPANQRTRPTATAPTLPEQPNQQPFQDVSWLSVNDSAQLRTQPNVVNFVWFKNSSAQYATTGMPFSSQYGWRESLSTPDVANATLGSSGTSVRFNAGEGDYDVNLYEPFAVQTSGQPTVYMFALNGNKQVQLYQTDRFTPVPLEQARASLPRQLPANPDLSPDLGR